MRDRQGIEERMAAARRLGDVPVRDMVPTQRDVLRAIATQRRGLSFIAEVTTETDIQRALDAEVSALAAPDAFLRAAAQARPPLIALDLCVTRPQAYAARIAGADAVLVPACLSPAELTDIMSGATTAHMLPILEVEDEAELGVALELRPRAVFLAQAGLAIQVRPGTTVLMVRSDEASQARSLKGVADAVLASNALVLDTAFQSLVAELDR